MANNKQRRLTVVVTGDSEELRKAVRAANEELDKLHGRADKVADGLQKWGKRAVAAGALAGAGLFKAAQSAGNLEQAVGGTESVFKESAEIIDKWAAGSAKNMGLSERAFREATTRLGGSLKGLGYDQEEAAEQSVRLTQLAADLAATYGGTTADAVDALAAAFRGEADPAERFNLFLNQSRVNAKAVAMGLAETTSNVSANAKAQATLALILEQSADAQGQFARESDTLIGRQQILSAQWEELQANLGQGVMPVLQQVVGALSELSGWFNELDPEVQSSIGKFATFAAGAVTLAGALSFAAGKAIAARDRFSNVGEDGARSLNKMGKAAALASGALALGGLIVAGYKLATSLDTANRFAEKFAAGQGDVEMALRRVNDIVELHTTTLNQLSAAQGGMVHDWQIADKEAADLSENLKQLQKILGTGNVVAAQRYRDAMAEAGLSTGEADALIADYTESAQQFNEDMRESAELLGATSDATDDAAVSQMRYTSATIDATAAIRAQAQALEDAWAAQFGATDLLRDVDEAIADFTGTQDAATGSSRRNAEAVDLVAKKQEALETATDRAESALESWLSAIEATEDANKALLKAQEDLDKALAGPSSDDREDTIAAEAEARRDQEEATWAVEDAQKALDEARKKGDVREIARAENNLERARDRVRVTTRAVRDAQAALNSVMGWSAQNDPKVAAAQDAVTAAQKRLDKATRDAAGKWQDLGKANQEAAKVAAASVASFGASDASLYNNRLNADATMKKYYELRDSIRSVILETLSLGLTEAKTLGQLDQLAERVKLIPGLTDEQRGQLLGAIYAAKGAAIGFAPGFSGFHSGGTYTAPTPGGSGWAWLQDGERVTRPAHGDNGAAPVVIVKLDNQVLASAQARYDKRNVATVIAG